MCVFPLPYPIMHGGPTSGSVGVYRELTHRYMVLLKMGGNEVLVQAVLYIQDLREPASPLQRGIKQVMGYH